MERVGSGSRLAVIGKANVPQILSEKACWPVAEPVVRATGWRSSILAHQKHVRLRPFQPPHDLF